MYPSRGLQRHTLPFDKLLLVINPPFLSVVSDSSRVWPRGPGLTVETHLWPREVAPRGRVATSRRCLPT